MSGEEIIDVDQFRDLSDAMFLRLSFGNDGSDQIDGRVLHLPLLLGVGRVFSEQNLDVRPDQRHDLSLVGFAKSLDEIGGGATPRVHVGTCVWRGKKENRCRYIESLDHSCAALKVTIIGASAVHLILTAIITT